ncbi:unnamed protein product [Gongylonema pulchrum]|uniref:ShKT domain-containing protein n=1 Tax=Gongylonema pulchrum TaxID=637853 RepID=A0A183DJ76_9BILA|nr:unnamed protein product [Gongylonema pulchrum]VDK65659.1 unnamed protein product [Gongylonema pulchrum]
MIRNVHNWSNFAASTCRDLDFTCAIWARLGECNDIFQQNTMHHICPYSCGLCDDENSNNNNNSNKNKTPKKPVKLCEDRGSYLTCKLALFFDECHEKADLCAKTCGAC